MSDESQPLANPTAWMVVYIANSEPEAYIVAGRLQSEGIPTFVHQEPVGKAYGLTIGALGEVKVLVSPSDFERAQEILDDDEDYESDDTNLALEDDESE